MKPHRHQVLGRRRERPIERKVATQRQPEVAVKTCFDCGLVDLAVALRGMSVAGAKESAVHPYRQKEPGACHQLFVVNVAAVFVGRPTVELAPFLRWCDSHLTEEGAGWQPQARRYIGQSSLKIYGNDGRHLHRRLGAEHPLERTDYVVAIRLSEADVDDIDLQNLPGLCAANRNRPG